MYFSFVKKNWNIYTYISYFSQINLIKSFFFYSLLSIYSEWNVPFKIHRDNNSLQIVLLHLTWKYCLVGDLHLIRLSEESDCQIIHNESSAINKVVQKSCYRLQMSTKVERYSNIDEDVRKFDGRIVRFLDYRFTKIIV